MKRTKALALFVCAVAIGMTLHAWHLSRIVKDQRIYIEGGCRGRYQGTGS